MVKVVVDNITAENQVLLRHVDFREAALFAVSYNENRKYKVYKLCNPDSSRWYALNIRTSSTRWCSPTEDIEALIDNMRNSGFKILVCSNYRDIAEILQKAAIEEEK
jgi:predicted peroxiredoxin